MQNMSYNVMSNIFFLPFVGKDYAKGGIFGKRIMTPKGGGTCGRWSRHLEWCLSIG